MSDCPIDFDLWDTNANGPHAFIQWKGTDVCADLRCSCGAEPHIDGDFAYAIRCANCGKAWELEPFVRLIEQSEPCRWHEPKDVDPDCSCGHEPCSHVDAWRDSGAKVPAGAPEQVEAGTST